MTPYFQIYGDLGSTELSSRQPGGYLPLRILLHDVADDIAQHLLRVEAEVELDLRRIVYGWRTIHHVSTTPGPRRKNKGHMFTGWYFQVT